MRRTHKIPVMMTVALLALSFSLFPYPLDDIHPITFAVAVTDKNDNPVIGLESRNFKVFEDNVEQTITSFGTSDKTIAVVILVEFGDTFVYYFLLASGVDTISKHSYNETLKKADASDTMIYSIGMAQFARTILEPYMEPSTQIGLLQADNVMRSLAKSTGGLSFFPRFSGEYPRIYETVNSDVRHQYTLRFASTNPKADGKLRKLKVEVIGTDIDHDGKPDKLKIRHKKGYYGSGLLLFRRTDEN